MTLHLAALLALALLAAGVASAQPASAPPRRQANARSWPRPKTPCPASLRGTHLLEDGPAGAPAVGRYLSPEQRAALAHPGSAPFARTFSLQGGTTEVVGWVSASSASLLVLRAHEAGGCVVSGWGTYFDDGTTLALAGSWTAPDGSLAVLLLHLGAKARGQAQETRWVVLATDGRRLWPAFGSEGRMQARVRSMKLEEHKGRLVLALTMNRTSHYAFDPKQGVFGAP